MNQYLDRYHGPDFEPYVTALGKVALAWNDLQNSLCSLFSLVTLEQRPQAGDAVNFVPTHIWHSIRSDRSQLEMLRAAIINSKFSNGTALIECGKWLCDRVGGLEDRRNDIMHSALIQAQFGTDTRKIVPNTFLKNPRAKKLENAADLLEEFCSTRHAAILLADYADALSRVLLNPHLPWPDKPSLQGRRPKDKPPSEGQRRKN